ncbi:hypothetical protein [Arenimonas oryziterrae]|uniref:Uncharacterized protein n=1 Tax=Arenimonas oryziterrae DSM 21050 = YC6267 TaxID=1121015 RepID=A0A091AUW7_9GAMM|nr:hypothetical protein [Arenimonas oryziterrae]KFN43047.1 hypothetical protein N789_10825 [Arenimonas oryziterrae DSM 21050 = YC6267]
MAALVGFLLAVAVGIFATALRLDRDRAFYPVVTIVVAAYYALFAVMGASTQTLVHEVLAGAVFLSLAVVGFRSSLWITAVALAGHGIFDFFHDAVIANPGVPSFWPAFCGSYDVTAGVYLAGLLWSGRVRATASESDSI